MNAFGSVLGVVHGFRNNHSDDVTDHADCVGLDGVTRGAELRTSIALRARNFDCVLPHTVGDPIGACVDGKDAGHHLGSLAIYADDPCVRMG